MKQALFIGAIASVLTLNAFADPVTVTTQDYVDTADALKQNKIPVTGTNSATPGDTVVTYTSTAGTIGERGILSDYDNYDSTTDSNKLVTASILDEVWDSIDAVYEDMPNLPNGTAGTVPVYNDDGELGSEERGIYDGSTTYNSSTDGDKLMTASALGAFEKTATKKACYLYMDGAEETDENCLLWEFIDTDVYGSCKAYNAAAADASECCSGILQSWVSPNKCGCRVESDCRNSTCDINKHICSKQL